MKDLLQKALELHQLYVGTPTNKFNLEQNVVDLRERLITEEYREVMAKFQRINDPMYFSEEERITNFVMELADLIVVTIGTVVQMGMADEFQAAYDLIFERNMAKAVDKETALAMLSEKEGRKVVPVAVNRIASEKGKFVNKGVQKYLVKDAFGKVIKPEGLKDVKSIILKMVEEKINKQ